MKNIPNENLFESLYPDYMKSDEYKIYKAEKAMEKKLDDLETSMSSYSKLVDEKALKIMDFQLKNLKDPAISKKLDTILNNYMKQSNASDEQMQILKKHQEQLNIVRKETQTLHKEAMTRQGFSVSGLGESMKSGDGVKGGLKAGIDYTKKSIMSSIKSLSFAGMTKGAMHFAGATLDSPALNIIASSIEDSTKKNDTLIELMKELNVKAEDKEEKKESKVANRPDKVESSDYSPLLANSLKELVDVGLEHAALTEDIKYDVKDIASRDFRNNQGSFSIKELVDVGLEHAALTEDIKSQSILMGKSLTSIDSRIAEMLFMYKDYANDSRSTKVETTPASAGGLAPKGPEDQGFLGEGLGTLLGGALGGGLMTAKGKQIAGKLTQSTKFLKKAAKLIPGIGGMVALVMSGYDAFTGATDEDYISQHEGVKKEDITWGQRVKHGAAKAASGLTFGMVAPESFLDKKSTYTAEDKDFIGKMVRQSEARGDYGMVTELNDNAGLSVGAYQFTEKSGSLNKMLTKYQDEGGEALPKHLRKNLSRGQLSTGQDKIDLQAYLKRQSEQNPEAFKKAQDTTFNEMYLDPAIEMANKYGIKDKGAVAMFIDHFHNRGAGGAKGMLESMKKQGIDLENVTAEQMAQARKDDYSQLISKNSSKAQFKKGWDKRVDQNLSAVTSPSISPVGENLSLPEVKSSSESIDSEKIGKEIGEVVSITIEKKMKAQPAPAPIVQQTTTGTKMDGFALEDDGSFAAAQALYGF